LVALSVIVSVAQAGGLDDDFSCADTAVAHGRSPTALTTRGLDIFPALKRTQPMPSSAYGTHSTVGP
jgi:hypothetical protein